jgi:hypothetical protein
MTNAKCLTEGVNVPAIDCVLFADPKQSVVDIVQAAGRALRVNEGKKFGYIMMPLIVPDHMELLEFTESTPFKQVARIVAGLSTQDERIVEELRLKSEGNKASTGRIEIIGTVPAGFQLYISSFATSIEAKYWERVGQINWRNFKEARTFAQQFKFRSEKEWRDFCKSNLKPKDLPANPAKIYKYQGWISMGDWLGTGFVATRARTYRNYEDAKRFVHTLKLKSGDEWKTYCESGDKPSDIPIKPNKTYLNNGWVSMGDWLGTGTLSNVNKNKSYYSFEEAKAYIRKLNLESFYDWETYAKSENRPLYIPFHPERTYKNDGWVSFNDWIGAQNTRKRENKYLEYFEAKKLVHTLGIKSSSDWIKFTHSIDFPNSLPKDPYKVYEHKWENWDEWLGKYLNWHEAKQYVHQLKITSISKWNKFTKSELFPSNIPKNPKLKYQDKGWKDWGDWLGTNLPEKIKITFLSFEKAREIVQKYKFNKTEDWFNFMKSSQSFIDIPIYPNKVYDKKGWISWGDWLGTKKIANFNRSFLEYDQAKIYSKSLKLNSVKEWMTFCRLNKLPANIPTNPQRTYKETGWKGWDDWLGTNRKATNKIIFYSFWEAKKLMRQHNIITKEKYNQFRKIQINESQLPSLPERTYADKGWISWADFLGKE